MTLGRSQGGARPTAAVLEQTDPKGNLEAVAGGGFRNCVAGVSGVNCRTAACAWAVAQLGERVVRNDEVSGSIPLSSTIGSPSAVGRLVRFNAWR